MTSSENQHQAFLPIFATLFFAAITSPMLMGWREHLTPVRSGESIVAEVRSVKPVVIAQCLLVEHRQNGISCDCFRR